MYLPLVLFAPRLSCMHGSVNTKSASATVCVLSFPMACVTAGFRLQCPAQTHALFLILLLLHWRGHVAVLFFCVIETFTRFVSECDIHIHLLGLVCISIIFNWSSSLSFYAIIYGSGILTFVSVTVCSFLLGVKKVTTELPWINGACPPICQVEISSSGPW